MSEADQFLLLARQGMERVRDTESLLVTAGMSS